MDIISKTSVLETIQQLFQNERFSVKPVITSEILVKNATIRVLIAVSRGGAPYTEDLKTL
jgi:hypothetical protein